MVAEGECVQIIEKPLEVQALEWPDLPNVLESPASCVWRPHCRKPGQHGRLVPASVSDNVADQGGSRGKWLDSGYSLKAEPT